MKLNIGEIIRKYRRMKDWTQEQFAEMLGVSFQSVSRWENGSTYPDIEFLPTIASLFEISMDELMGFSKEAQEERLQQRWNEYNNITDPEEAYAFLIELRKEFRNEWSIPHAMLELIYENRFHMEELQPITMDILENCKYFDIRWDAVKLYLYTADEKDITPEFLYKYTSYLDRYTLLEKRYLELEDWDNYESQRQTNLVLSLQRIFNERLRKGYHSSAENSAWAQKKSLEILNLLTDDYSGEIMNTEPDLWFSDKIYLGLRYSAALASSGKQEEALNILEKTVELIEITWQLADGSELTYRCKTLDLVTAKIFTKQDTIDGLVSKSIQSYNKNTKDLFDDEFYLPWYVLEHSDGWEWFDPIRNEERYQNCILRLKKLAYPTIYN